MYPDMKIGAEIDDRDGTVNHAWAYGEDGRSHDYQGTHDDDQAYGPIFHNSHIDMDVDPRDLAENMRIDYDPDEPWSNSEIAQAGHLINRHWHGDDDYEGDDGYYDPGRAKDRGHRTASKTDGIRYAAVVDADVAEDLRRLAMPAQDAYDDFLPHYLRKRETPPAQGEFFHGSDHEYQPGDVLESVRARGDQARIDYMENQVGSPSQANWVWMHKHPDHVRPYGKNVYQVEPMDEGPWPWNGPRVDSWDGRPLRDDEPDDPDQEPKRYVSPRARVIRKITSRIAMPQPLPKGVYFRYHPELMWSPGVTAHLPGGKQVGSLEWYDDDHVMVDLGTRKPGEIDRISVPEDHRGHSIATSMFDFAKQHEPRLHHSETLTEDGRGWSEYEKARHASTQWPDPSRETIPADPNYVYHGTHDFNAQDIADYGHLDVHDPDYGTDQDSWPDGSVEPRSYWTHDPQVARSFYPEGGRPALLRSRRDSGDFRQEKGSGDLYSTSPISADHLEVYSGPGQWTPLLQHRARHARLAAVTQDLVDRLKGEFHAWRKQQPKGSIFGGGVIGGLDHWPNIENFLKDQYPAAHRGLDMGYEEARTLLDHDELYPAGHPMADRAKPYDTGPQAVAKHGYDPKEIAAGMLLLHNKTDRFRGDLSDEDQARLHDIARKRYRMQRDYEQRHARLAMAWQDWAPKIQHWQSTDEKYPGGMYYIEHRDLPDHPLTGTPQSYLDYNHTGPGEVSVGMLYAHEDRRKDGVAEALMRRLHKDHPGHKINPGAMTSSGQAFHDQMLNKEPQARSVVSEGFSLDGPFPLGRLAGRNGDLPPLTFEPFNTLWSNGIMARHAEDGRPVGHLHWMPRGEIDSIVVHPELQRRGIGKAMLEHARNHPDQYSSTYPIFHSQNLSKAGRAWAAADGHHLPDEQVHPADDDPANWGFTAVDQYVPLSQRYNGQNEDEMSRYLEQPWTPPARTAAAGDDDGWPVWWRGRHRPAGDFDDRWSPNHPQRIPAPWES